MANDDAALHQLFKLLFQAHPWHGVSPGAKAPAELSAYIEIVPTDPVKYELDKGVRPLARRSAATVLVNVPYALRIHSPNVLWRRGGCTLRGTHRVDGNQG